MKTKNYNLLSSVKQGLFALACTLMSGIGYSQVTFTFNYTGGVQTHNVQGGNYRIECWGGNGGDGSYYSSQSPNNLIDGGKGGYSTGTVTINTPVTWYIYVAGKGTNVQAGNNPGGFNGGGNSSSPSFQAGSGGGATHVATTTGLLSTLSGNQSAVLIVAGGGGGGGNQSLGGDGGGLNGVQPPNSTQFGNRTAGGGGSQTAGGACYTSGFGAGFGQGGTTSQNLAGGGGGGWYGGCSGDNSTGGGGGSGYVGGVTNGLTVEFGQPGFVANPDPNGDGYVVITRLCDVNVSASSNPMCLGDQVVLSTNAGSGINWSTGATTQSITVSPTSNTSYTVSGISSSSTACTNTLVVTVSVNPLPNVSANGVPSVVCVGSTATLNAFGAGTYTWSNSLSGWSTTVAPPATGVYSVTGTDANGCKNQATVEVTVNTNALDVTPPVTICSGSSQSLTASGGASPSSYTWFPQANFPTIIVSPTVTTTYVVAATDIHNCLITGSVEVTVVDRPNIIASVDRDQICRGETVTLSATGGDNYTWSNGLTGPTHNVQLNADVTYTYAVTGSDANGCTGTGTTAVVVGRCTGLDESVAHGLISIAPNPSAGVFRLTFEEKDSRNIRVTDLTGKLIYQGKTEDSDTVLDLSGYPGGVYSVQVISASTSTTHKLIKE